VLEGGTLTLSDHRGEVVILNFWATWCAPCIVEVPELVALQDELAPGACSSSASRRIPGPRPTARSGTLPSA
jgi:thiol-disulfide isomerase/thioredoxin